MRVNKEIKNMLITIATEAIRYQNEDKTKYEKYLISMYNTFNRALNDEEKKLILTYLILNLGYKHMLFDEEVILKAGNLKLRSYLFIFILSSLFVVLIDFLFTDSNYQPEVFKNLIDAFKLLTSI